MLAEKSLQTWQWKASRNTTASCLLLSVYPIFILLMYIRDRKGAPKADTQIHSSTIIFGVD